MLTPYERAQRYIEKAPGAVSGDAGHNQTFSIACTLVNGFALPEADAWALLCEYNQRCSPPWTEKELRHKLQSATSAHHDKPRGHLLGKSFTGAPTPARTQRPAPTVNAPPTPKPVKSSYDLSTAAELPKPVEDGTRALIRALFQPGEGIRIAPAILNDEGREIPDGGGVCLSREEWLQKLDRANGNPNGIFSSTKKTGIYVAINPYRIGCTRDADVTEFRHALVEFDQELSPEQQYQLYTLSRLPCAAIIESGGKSVHAWVRINAKDRQEYDDRVKALYGHFESCGLPIDVKNKNPGRFSRLPNCVRFERRQELLALNVGCESFTEWLKFIDGEELGKCDRFNDLIALDTTNDPNCVIGFDKAHNTLRYLCRGKAAWIIGPSGVGKSSLISEFAISWALGKPAYGITPARPLKSLIIQAENDRYDLAEMVQGISRAYGLDPFVNEAEFEQVDKNVLFKTETRATGQAFVDRMHRLIDREKPDIVWPDPLLSFAGIEVSKQDQVTHFLRELLAPVLEATGVVLIGVHHTGKPKNSKEVANWTAIDWAYSGLGSSELVNWARAVMMLRPVNDTTFELKLAKRGARAWATNPNGEFTTSIWLQHAKKGIRWEQINPPEEPAEQPKEKKQTKAERMAYSPGVYDVLAAIPAAGESANAVGARLHAYSRKRHDTLSMTTCRTTLLDLLVESKKLRFDENLGLYFRGENV